MSETIHTSETHWRKSGRCANGTCLEVAALPGGAVATRDSKQGHGGERVILTPASWRGFVQRIKDGALDLA